MKKNKLNYLIFKKALDYLMSFILIILLLPIIFIIGIIIKLDSKGPVIFIQERIGKNQKHFKIYKFRTMKQDTPKNKPTHLLESPDLWLTRIGRLLRKTSLDELPQLLNILKGDMSFIGPRPALWNQADLIEEREKYQVHKIRPGITGYAQVYGRDTLSILEKAKLDYYYAQNISFKLDIMIFFKTFIVVLNKKGYAEGQNNLDQNTIKDSDG